MRSKEWFYGRCLDLLQQNNNFNGIEWRALRLGVAGDDGTRGHMTHSIGVSQKFLEAHPAHVATIQGLPMEVIDYHGHAFAQVLADFQIWIDDKHGEFGGDRFGYDYDTFKVYMTPLLGGGRAGGGGGNNEFGITLRLVAEYL